MSVLPVCMLMYHVNAVPMEARRGQHVSHHVGGCWEPGLVLDKGNKRPCYKLQPSHQL